MRSFWTSLFAQPISGISHHAAVDRRPSTAECLVLAGEVMRTAIDSVGITGFKPDVSLRRHLAHLSARQISQLTLEAVAHAVAAQRKELQKGNFPRWLFDPEATGESSTPPHYMH